MQFCAFAMRMKIALGRRAIFIYGHNNYGAAS